MQNSDDEYHDTPEDLRKWLQQQVRDVMKGAELRIKDATDFVTAFAVGALSQEEVEKRKMQYDIRWGDAIPRGIETKEGMTNDEILHEIDVTARTVEPGSFTDRWLKEQRGRATGQKQP